MASNLSDGIGHVVSVKTLAVGCLAVLVSLATAARPSHLDILQDKKHPLNSLSTSDLQRAVRDKYHGLDVFSPVTSLLQSQDGAGSKRSVDSPAIDGDDILGGSVQSPAGGEEAAVAKVDEHSPASSTEPAPSPPPADQKTEPAKDGEDHSSHEETKKVGAEFAEVIKQFDEAVDKKTKADEEKEADKKQDETNAAGKQEEKEADQKQEEKTTDQKQEENKAEEKQETNKAEEKQEANKAEEKNEEKEADAKHVDDKETATSIADESESQGDNHTDRPNYTYHNFRKGFTEWNKVKKDLFDKMHKEETNINRLDNVAEAAVHNANVYSKEVDTLFKAQAAEAKVGKEVLNEQDAANAKLMHEAAAVLKSQEEKEATKGATSSTETSKSSLPLEGFTELGNNKTEAVETESAEKAKHAVEVMSPEEKAALKAELSKEDKAPKKEQ